MAKNTKAESVFDVTGILPKQEKKINNTHKQYTENINTKNVAFNVGVQKKETKSKRVNLVLQPSLYERAQAFADANNISFNEMVSQLLQQLTEPTLEYTDGSIRPDGQLTGQLSIEDM